MTGAAAISHRVGICAARPFTARSLQGYLRAAGLEAQVITAEQRNGPADIDAVVIFPDDCSSVVLRGIRELLRQARPGLLIVVVTRSPNRLRPLLALTSGCSPVILPRPAFGWTILDALRGHVIDAG